MLALSSSQFDLKRTPRCPVHVQNSNTAFDLEKWVLLRDAGNPSRMLAAGNAAKRQAVLCPRQTRLGLLDCGACCGDPSKVDLWRENWKARLPP